MEAYQERVVNEKRELDEKMEKLDNFIKAPGFDGLPTMDSGLLKLQLGTMKIYSDILDVRIERFKEK